MEKLIQSIRELEANGEVSKDMYPFLILKQYLTDTISYREAMDELLFDSRPQTNLVRNIIKKHRRIKK